jgi:hypothetical protein
MIHHCSKINGWKIPWNSIRGNKNQGGGGASGGSFDDSATKLWYHGKHAHLSGGRNESGYNTTWGRGDNNSG